MEEENNTLKESQYERLKFELRDFEIANKINYGRLGSYFICHRKKRNKNVIMKIFTKSKLLAKNQKDKIQTEIKLYQQLSQSPFFPELKGLSFKDSRYIAYQFDFYPGGLLSTKLQKQKQFTLEQGKFYAACIIRMLDFMHKKGIIYRDLRPDNLIIKADGYLTLLDITYAKELINGNYTQTLCGKPNYIAPELILSKSYGKGVDWWAFGVILYELYVGIDPFNANDPMLIYQNILTSKMRFPKIMDKDAKSLINHLLNPEPKRRYGCLKDGVIDIIEHRLFNDFKWKDFDSFKMEPPFIPKVTDANDISHYFTKEEIVKMEEEKAKQKEIENDAKKESKNQPRGKVEVIEPLDIDPEAEDVVPEEDPFLEW